MSVKGTLKPESVRSRTLAFVTERGAASIRDVEKGLDVPTQQVWSALTYLHGAGFLYIAGWGVSPFGRTVAIYRPGPGEDAPRPPPTSPVISKRASRASRNWGSSPAEIDKTLSKLRDTEAKHYQALILDVRNRIAELQDHILDLRARQEHQIQRLELSAAKAKAALKGREAARVGPKSSTFGTSTVPLSLLDQLQRASL